MEFTFQFYNSGAFVVVSPPASSGVIKKIPKSTEQLQLGIFVLLCQKISYRKNKENTTHDTKKPPPGAIHFSVWRKKGTKTPKLSLSLFFPSSGESLIVVKHIHHAQPWRLPEQNQILVPGQQNYRTWGRISCHRQSCVRLFALAKFLFIYVNLQPFFFFYAGPSPGEPPSEEFCPNFDENCHVTSLS